ncbi:MAG: hypothetical protein ABIQ95_05075 [Bdellovibrionia bacterium]
MATLQKLIVDLGNDRFLITSSEILEMMINNKQVVDVPTFELPQRDKSFKDWAKEVRGKWFPSKKTTEQQIIILPE